MNFLYLNSDRMGTGDEALGRRLLVGFLRELASSDATIDMVGCLNSGIALTTEEGEALDALRELEAKGATIATCGTCLDHAGKRDELKVGQVGNLKQAVALMITADRIIAPC